MKAPDASKHNPDPNYIRKLIERTGLTQEQAAERIGLSGRTMRVYITLDHAKRVAECPYPVQYCLESLRASRRVKASRTRS